MDNRLIWVNRTMFSQFCNFRFYLVLLADTVLFIISFVGAYLVRFDFILEPHYCTQVLNLLPVLLPVKIFTFFIFGLYRGMWRFTGLNDLWRLVQATFFSTMFSIVATLYLYSFQGVPRKVFLMDGVLTLVLCGGLRLGIRSLYRTFYSSRTSRFFTLPDSNGDSHEKKSFLIVGAGSAGEKIYREIMENPRLNYDVVGFLDDDSAKWGRTLHGRTIYGGVELLPTLIKRQKIAEVMIAIPSATGSQMRRLVDICKSCDVRYRTLPEIGAIIDGKVSIKILRDVKYEDLLRRPPTHLDTSEIIRYLRGKRVLVTGAGGSIGSELCRQIIRFEPQELILVDASEENLFNIQMELGNELNFSRHHGILCRVQDQPLMDNIFYSYQPQILFHAAAYKHVPMLEKNPWEAIFNNVAGTGVVMQLSLKYDVERFVLVSTDKAVRPTNVMGASKRLGELMMHAFQGNGTRFMAVRFGNVIGSSGSVLPLFRRQLEHGGPITVTHPEVTRYFMTIAEAAQLILQAGGLGQGGEIFILEMGTPVKIAQMAEELVRLSGKEPGRDVEIVFTGLRAGEKLCEELITKGEGIMNTKYEKIMVLRSDEWNGKQSQAELSQWLDKTLEELYQIAGTYNVQAIKEKLSEMLLDYNYAPPLDVEYAPKRDLPSYPSSIVSSSRFKA